MHRCILALLRRYLLLAAIGALVLPAGAAATHMRAPTVSVVIPKTGAIVRGTVTLDAAASDDGGVKAVRYYVDGLRVASDTTCCAWDEPWSSASVADGEHKIVAKAWDWAGNVGVSAAVTFSVDNVVDATPDSRTPVRWLATGANANTIADADGALATYHFDTPLAIVRGNEDGDQNQVPSGYASTPALKYESYARFKSDLEGGKIDPSIRSVEYDPENWTETPDDERKRPSYYLPLFAKLAKAAGYEVVESPARDLVAVTGGECTKRSGETRSEAYLRCRLPYYAALESHAVNVQAQVHEDDAAKYRWFVGEARKLALEANPIVEMYSGLSTSPWGIQATPEMLYAAHRSVYPDLVVGHFLTISSAELQVGIEFLRKVGGG
ncbi:MAG: Ig-like domain-containing protein [Actinomycetota bacterium]|nr:Ig-like domain-containing protein [Actinomycetota bacterium]